MADPREKIKCIGIFEYYNGYKLMTYDFSNYMISKKGNVQINTIRAVSKMVKMIDKKTGEVLKIFRCLSDAHRYFGKKPTINMIGKVCKGKEKSAFGYKWQYVKKGEKINKHIEDLTAINTN